MRLTRGRRGILVCFQWGSEEFGVAEVFGPLKNGAEDGIPWEIVRECAVLPEQRGVMAEIIVGQRIVDECGLCTPVSRGTYRYRPAVEQDAYRF